MKTNKTIKWNNLCEGCTGDCKQPQSVMMVSCPKYDRADKTIDMFDSKGNIKDKAINSEEKKPHKRKSLLKKEINKN